MIACIESDCGRFCPVNSMTNLISDEISFLIEPRPPFRLRVLEEGHIEALYESSVETI